MGRTTSVTLGEHYDGYIAELIQQGRYQTVSEVLRDALRQLEQSHRREEKLEALRAEIEKGRNSPVIKDFDMDELIQELKRRHNAD